MAPYFTDLGVNWEDYQQYQRLKNRRYKKTASESGGRIHTFILQTFLLTISLDWAKPPPVPGTRSSMWRNRDNFLGPLMFIRQMFLSVMRFCQGKRKKKLLAGC